MTGLRPGRALIAVVLAVNMSACERSGTPDEPAADASGARLTAASFVGSAACGACHEEQKRLWNGSHHDLAMGVASESSNAGDFDDTEFLHQGVRTRFYTRDGQYFTETDSEDGSLQEFPVRYTFGTYPLQQYLVELPDGRIQALGVSWDSRPVEQGGQRWFHVYGDEPIDHTDVLHWTQMSQNWNSMCADCHSTGLVSRFDVDRFSFETSWAEIDVACEACHGPGSRHVSWAESPSDSSSDDGLLVQLNERRGITWILDPKTGNSSRSQPRETETEITVCAPCHSRRAKISDTAMPVEQLLDHYLPALIQPDLYYPDGQINDEVYVYGSFLQSRMYQQGVTCSDCHEPHSLELLAPGPDVCVQCHAAEKFATPDHHLHPVDSAGANCIECHMPPKTYMQVDVRHDHSFRVPRLQLSAELELPDPCTACHVDRDTAWAAAATVAQRPHWSDLLARAQTGTGAGTNLLTLAVDGSVPAIIRATAMVQAPVLGSVEGTAALADRAADDDALVRWATARALQYLDPATRVRVGVTLLDDPVKAVRLAAMYALLPLGLEVLAPQAQRSFDLAVQEYMEVQLVQAERAEAHVNLANLYRMLNRYDDSERAYRTAIRVNPYFIPAYVNLADLFRILENEAQGELILREGLRLLPGQGALHHSLGLMLVRDGRINEAMTELATAAQSGNATPRYALAYALAIDAQGNTGDAIAYLNEARQRFSDDQALIAALLIMYERIGDMAAAVELRRLINIPVDGSEQAVP